MFNELPIFSKLSYSQFETLFPFVPIFDNHLTDFVSYKLQCVIIEFPLFLKYILENDNSETITKTSKEYISISEDLSSSLTSKTHSKGSESSMPYVSYNGIKEDAKEVHSFITSVNDYFSAKGYGIGKVTLNEVHEDLPKQLINMFERKVSNNTERFKRLWETFLINIGIMNIRSVILCSENSGKGIPNSALIPIRFIPKIGQELNAFFPIEKNLSLTEIKERLIEGRLENKYEEDVYIGSLSKEEEINFIDLDDNLYVKPVYMQEFAEKLGYTTDRYTKAEEHIIFSASTVTSDLDECKQFLDNFVDYIGTLGLLVGQLRELGKGSTCIILDFQLR